MLTPVFTASVKTNKTQTIKTKTTHQNERRQRHSSPIVKIRAAITSRLSRAVVVIIINITRRQQKWPNLASFRVRATSSEFMSARLISRVWKERSKCHYTTMHFRNALTSKSSLQGSLFKNLRVKERRLSKKRITSTEAKPRQRSKRWDKRY